MNIFTVLIFRWKCCCWKGSGDYILRCKFSAPNQFRKSFSGGKKINGILNFPSEKETEIELEFRRLAIVFNTTKYSVQCTMYNVQCTCFRLTLESELRSRGLLNNKYAVQVYFLYWNCENTEPVTIGLKCRRFIQYITLYNCFCKH